MQNWLSNFYIFSFQSSNFQFSPLTFNFCQFKAPLLLLLLLSLNPLNDLFYGFFFFFFFKFGIGSFPFPNSFHSNRNRHCNRHSLSLQVFRQNHNSGAARVKSHEIKLPHELLSSRSLRRRRAARWFVRLSLLRREIASLTFPHEIQQNSIPKNIIIILYIFKLK